MQLRASSAKQGATTALFICGSHNQTTQLETVARELVRRTGIAARFSPFYGDRGVELLRRSGLLERTIGGNKAWARASRYLVERGFEMDVRGLRGPYDLVVTCTDLVVPLNVRNSPLVVVQEGILDPEGAALELVQRFPFLPRWLAGTAATGLSGRYDRFCVASEGYREHFVSRGARAERIVVTGIPNFDDCERFRDNDFPFRGYVLVCTSDARETLKRDDRQAFIRRVVALAAGRPIIFKLHPNENVARAASEIATHAPGARAFSSGSAEEMIANCDVLVTQYSSTAFVGLALGKEVHSLHGLDTLRRLLPEQNRSAAKNIADVCVELLESPGRHGARSSAAPHASLETAA